MKPSEKPRAELAKTKICIEGMRNAKSLDQFEEHWNNFLHALERIWFKAAHHYGKSSKWNGWKGKYEKLRKEDPLLAYLIRARGAEEHSVNEIVARDPGSIGINPIQGKSLYIENMTINEGHIFIQTPQGIRVDFSPSKTKLVPIVFRGRTYPVPVSHLGEPIDPDKVIEISEIAARFYESFLNDAESSFVK